MSRVRHRLILMTINIQFRKPSPHIQLTVLNWPAVYTNTPPPARPCEKALQGGPKNMRYFLLSDNSAQYSRPVMPSPPTPPHPRTRPYLQEWNKVLLFQVIAARPGQEVHKFCGGVVTGLKSSGEGEQMAAALLGALSLSLTHTLSLSLSLSLTHTLCLTRSLTPVHLLEPFLNSRTRVSTCSPHKGRPWRDAF